MTREYLNYVSEACKNGMSGEEVSYLFNDIYKKSNTRQGKRVLRLFSRGIGKAKQNTLRNKNTMEQSIQTYQAQPQQYIQQPIQEKGYQYFKQ